MLSTYQVAKFAVPENPVMRAVYGIPVMPSAGATTGPLQKTGLGCACGIKPFGLGNVNDEGLRLYGDWYGSQQHGGMRLNGDPNGLGAFEDFVSNLTSGNFGAALSGNDFASSVPNWLFIGGALWFLFTINNQQKSARRSAGAFVARVKRRRAGKTKTDWSEA